MCLFLCFIYHNCVSSGTTLKYDTFVTEKKKNLFQVVFTIFILFFMVNKPKLKCKSKKSEFGLLYIYEY